MKIAAHLIAVIHLFTIASNTVFNLAHLLDVASNTVVAAFSKLLQFGFAISITSNRFSKVDKFQVRDLSSYLNTLTESEAEGVQGAATTGVFLFPEPEGLYLESERAVSREEGLALAKELGCLLLESSAKTRENVEQCFEELALKELNQESEISSPK
ncbi:hypothetical protein Ahy_A05g023830 [Arachis hypogaea]|uniref:Uncharacterized protein n=1 Tax=Arachis hypogaea TaxID=3818 RepID=A0A445D4V2_ARAHY|nr:hypothetical protein Ahy_A05g023830 [Arachis hypogaea]